MSVALTAVSEAAIVLSTVPLVGIELGQTAITVVGVSMILLLLVGSGFFSSSEIALFSLPTHQIDAMVEEGKRGARAVKSLKEDPHRLLVTVLVGNNLVNITMSSISTTIVGFYFAPSTAVLVSSFGITSMVLLFGESAPKSYAVNNTGSWARTVAPPLTVVGKLLWPLITVFYYLTGAVSRIVGGNLSMEDSHVSRDEIRNMIRTSEREGVLDEEERQILQRALGFADASAKEIMTPRLDVTAVSTDETVEAAIRTCIESGHARLPAYDGSLDNVVGVFDIRELGESDADRFDEIEVGAVVEPTLHVPESKNVDELFSEMQEKRLHMVIVIDEFGSTEGLITIEDVTERIVGEILTHDEERPIEFVEDGTAVVSGSVDIEKVNESLDIVLPEQEEFETIAGFMFSRAGRLVEQGEEFTYGDVKLRAEQVENTRIQKVRVSVDRDSANADEEASLRRGAE